MDISCAFGAFGENMLTTQTGPEQKTLNEPVDLLGIKVYQPNLKWDQYHIYDAQLAYWNAAEQWFPADQKLIFRGTMENGKVNDLRPVRVLSQKFELFPNEELKTRLDKWAGAAGYDYYQDDRYSAYSKDKNAAFFTYLPKGESNGSYFITGQDSVKVGFLARNSVDGTVGFGLDLFTYRGLCYNGSIVTTRIGDTEGNLGTSRWDLHTNAREQGAQLAHKHTKGLEDVLDRLDDHMEDLRNLGDQLINYYKNLTQLKLNEEMANRLAASPLPQYALPFEVDTKSDKGIRKPILTESVKNKTLWDAYNDVTHGLWFNQKMDSKSKYSMYAHLHRAMEIKVAA